MNDPKITLEALCLEAVRVCGSDFAAVERYVLERVGALEPADGERINREVRRLVGFQAPGFSEHGPN